MPILAILPLLEAPYPRLHVISTPVNTIDDGLRTLVAARVEQMYDAPESGWPHSRF
jgi:peptide deformylase